MRNGKTPAIRMTGISVRSICRGFLFAERNMPMDEREPLLRLRKDEKGNQGIILFKEDKFVMEQLVIHQTLRSLSIHELFQCQSDTPRNPNSLTNRIGKLRAAGLLVALKEKPIDVRGSLYIYHYKLGSRGVDSLIDLGCLSVREGEQLKYILSNIRVAPSKHTRCISHIATQSFIQSYKSGLMERAIHKRGSMHSIFTSSQILNKGRTPEIIPDWVFEKDSTVISIEMDTGSQSMSVILTKCKRYVCQAKKLEDDKKQLIVIFSVADDSVPGDYSSNRKRRIGSIKELIPTFVEWPRNLSFYVVPAKRTAPLVERLLSFVEPYSDGDRLLYAEEWLDKAELVLEKSYDSEPVSKNHYFNVNRNKKVDCQILLSVRMMRRESVRKIHAIISGEEGSVRTFQLIRANAARSLAASEIPNKEKMQILVCYADESSMTEEVYLQNSAAIVSFTNLDRWVQAMNGDGEVPEINTFVSRVTTERRTFNG